MAKSNVAQFAEKLKMPVASLLEQLNAAGVRKKTADDAVTEQDILDLEREAFLKLLGTKQTQDRIKAMLETGKPLRN